MLTQEFITNNDPSVHLWENQMLLNYQKDLKYYEYDRCFQQSKPRTS